MTTISYRAQIFREGASYVALCPDLNNSSFGDTPEEARDSLQQAVEAFLEGCGMLGTSDAIPAESDSLRVCGTGDLERSSGEKAALAMLFLDTV